MTSARSRRGSEGREVFVEDGLRPCCQGPRGRGGGGEVDHQPVGEQLQADRLVPRVEVGRQLALFLFCLLASASYLFMEIYAVFRPGQSQALLARFRTWIDTHTDQVIISGSLILGFWLIANSLYLILT